MTKHDIKLEFIFRVLDLELFMKPSIINKSTMCQPIITIFTHNYTMINPIIFSIVRYGTTLIKISVENEL